jgi:hypothetical protein
MFTLAFEPTQRVLLVRFSRSLTREALDRMSEAVRMFAGRVGPTRGIVDFSDVETVDVPTEAIIERGRRRPVMGNAERIFVAPQSILFGLSRLFASYQEGTGNQVPVIVHTVQEAYKRFDLDRPNFEPFDSAG